MQEQSESYKKETVIKIIVVGVIISVISGIIVSYFRLYANLHWFRVDKQQKPPVSSTPEPGFFCETPPDVSDPEIPLKVIDYSSQQDASHPASAVVDDSCRTVWISGAFSASDRYLALSARNEALMDISSIYLCAVPPDDPQAAMVAREMSLFSSLDMEPPRNLSIIGTYDLPQGQPCYHLKLTVPITLKVLVIYINESAGDPSALVSEISIYGLNLGDN